VADVPVTSGKASGVSVRVYSEIYTSRPPAEVWRCLSDLTWWTKWSPICRGCRTADSGAVRVGSTLLMRLRILGLTLTIRTRVVCANPPEVIGWEFRGLGIKASHTYRLRHQGTGTLMSNEEILTGLPRLPRFLVRSWFASTDLSRRSLSGIRTLVERAVPAPQ
jgi:hypothetical protein